MEQFDRHFGVLSAVSTGSTTVMKALAMLCSGMLSEPVLATSMRLELALTSCPSSLTPTV